MLVEGKNAVVTGGTRGIGLAIVRKLLEHGANVAVAGSRMETAEAAVAKLIEEDAALADRLIAIAPNLNDADAVAAAFAEVVDAFGSLDILCNNAGVSSRTPLVDYTVEEFERIVDLNLNAVFVCSQAAVRIMLGQESGVIINTSSMVAKMGQPSGAYPTTKFAVNGLTLSLARELAGKGIRVNAVAPGVTHTDMVDALPDEVIKPLIATIPLGRMGEPEDIANGVVFLASDMASYISGVVLPIDGLART